jgi:hypothetical protein
MNKSKIRLAGGLVVLLMTVILAVTTAKSYACWYITGSSQGVVLTCGHSCWAMLDWSDPTFVGDGLSCVQSPAGSGTYGYEFCGQSVEVKTVETGYTIFYGSCHGGDLCTGAITQRDCVTGTKNVPVGTHYFYGGCSEN